MNNCKIYYQNKIIILKKNIDFKETQTNLTDKILDFINNKDKEFLIYTDNIEQTIRIICEKFEYIEAAGGLVKNSKNEILAIYRMGYWDLPKGKIEQSESPEKAAIREVSEECNIEENKLEILKHRANTFHIYKKENNFVLKKTYWFAMIYKGNTAPTPQKEEQIEQAKWLNKNELHEFKAKTYPTILEVLSFEEILKELKGK